MSTTNFNPPWLQVPLVDLRTGRINEAWAKFLIDLWVRSGSGTPPPVPVDPTNYVLLTDDAEDSASSLVESVFLSAQEDTPYPQPYDARLFEDEAIPANPGCSGLDLDDEVLGVLYSRQIEAGTGLTGGGSFRNQIVTLNVESILDSTARVQVLDNATLIGARRAINFIEGPNIITTLTDDAVNERVDVTITATPTTLTLGSDFITSAASMQSVTGMSIAVGANQVWKIEVRGKYQTAAATTGAGISLLLPAGATVSGLALIRQAANGTASFFQASLTVSDENWASASVIAPNTDYIVFLSAVVAVGASAGNIQLRWRSEVAASNAVLRAGSRMIGQRLS